MSPLATQLALFGLLSSVAAVLYVLLRRSPGGAK